MHSHRRYHRYPVYSIQYTVIQYGSRSQEVLRFLLSPIASMGPATSPPPRSPGVPAAAGPGAAVQEGATAVPFSMYVSPESRARTLDHCGVPPHASPGKLHRGCGLPRGVRSKGHCRCWNCRKHASCKTCRPGSARRVRLEEGTRARWQGYAIIVRKPVNKHITSTSAAPTRSSLLQWRSSTWVASVLPSIFLASVLPSIFLRT